MPDIRLSFKASPFDAILIMTLREILSPPKNLEYDPIMLEHVEDLLGAIAAALPDLVDQLINEWSIEESEDSLLPITKAVLRIERGHRDKSEG
jgi:hypothetical protein